MLRRLLVVLILISTFAVAGCKISGTITLDGEGLEGVTVYLNGEGEDEGISIMATTLADGTYVFEGFHHGTLTITPEIGDYTFIPDSETVTVDFFENVLDVDFTAVVEEPEPTRSSEKSEVPWSTYQGNAAHTGYVPVFLNTNEFFEAWTRNIFEVAGLDPDTLEDVALNPVAAGDGKVFITTAGYDGPNVAVALDSATGTEQRTYDFDELNPLNPIYYIGPPAYSNGTVYIQSNNHNKDSFVWAFDVELDKIIFQTAYSAQWDRYYAPTIYDKNVYIGGGYHGGAYGFNGDDGKELWHVELNQYDQWTPAVNEAHVIAYTGLYEPQLTVINRSTGLVDFIIPDANFVWDGWSMDLAPVLGSQNNVIAIHDGRLINFDLEAKAIGWEIQEETGGFIGQPSLANETIYALYEGSLQALDESSSDLIWEWQLPVEIDKENENESDDESEDENDDARFPMIVTDNLIFISTATTTYAVDLESQTDVWDYPAGGHLALSDDGILFIATSKGILHAISTVAIEEF